MTVIHRLAVVGEVFEDNESVYSIHESAFHVIGTDVTGMQRDEHTSTYRYVVDDLEYEVIVKATNTQY